jgi:solute carrier family 39 (zinc transporter), member 1/2/3
MWLTIAMTAAVVAVAIAAGAVPFVRRRSPGIASFPDAEALTTGIFLGAGLIHMLGDATAGFAAQGVSYPWPVFLAGVVLLALLGLEHVGHGTREATSLAALATLMLSIHSFLAGAALGTATKAAVATVVFLAIMAHKWAASFALSLKLNETALPLAIRLGAFGVFVGLFPFGVTCGRVATSVEHANPLLTPIFSALAAGTFIYLGTLHGLANGTLVARCREFRTFALVVLGYAIMAVVAIWT